jgi:hypothetical protein
MRRLFSLLTVALLAAGCTTAAPNSNGSIPSSPVVISPYIQGFTELELDAYLNWWRTANLAAPADGWEGPVISVGAAAGDAALAVTTVHKPLDPACPISYDYEKMGAVSFENGDGLQIREISGTSGFYSAERSEALMILSGTTIGGSCGKSDSVGYLVVRVSLQAGNERWIIDGLASPAATLTVAVDPGNKLIKVKDNKVELDDSAVSGYSPFRLRRFAITDANRDRVFEFAKIGRGSDQIGRRLLWFRASDLAGAYRASGCAPIAAFWGSGHGCKSSVPDLNSQGSETTTVWLDEMARQSDVITHNEDDTYCGVTGDSCLALDNDRWSAITKVTKVLASSAGKASSERASAEQMRYFAQLLAGSGGANATACSGALVGFNPGIEQSNEIKPNGGCSYKLDWAIAAARIPDELIYETRDGIVYPYADVFAVVVSGGKRAWEDTRDRMKESVPLQSVVGYFAGRDRIDGDSVTLSPSYRFVGGEDAAWYKRFSYLFGDASNQGPASMTFSTASIGDRSLRYDPSPASQIRITVTDTLNPNVKVTYKSEWLPTQAIGQFDDPASSLGDCGTFDFGCHITRAITGFTTTIYQATFGAMLEGLSKGTVGNMLGVPILQQYEIEAVRDIAGGQQVIYKINQERLRTNPDSSKVGEPGEDLCLTYAQSGALNRFDPPGSTNRAEPAGGEECYQQSGTWGLFNAARGIMMVLLVVFIARYVLQLMVGRARQMTITAFIARCFISLFLIFYVGDVLRVLGTVVAEVIVITNTIGSQVSGKPYSHLWMFSAYLNSPPAGANPFALLLMAPFTILGLLVMAIVGWVRLVLAALIVAASPIWIVNLLSSREPRFFYQSLLFLLRLYVIPVIALVLMLAIFLLLGSNDSFFGGSNDIVSIPRAIVGMIILIVVAVVPVFAAKSLINKVGRPIQSAIQGALSAADDERTENFLNNTGREAGDSRNPYGSSALTEGTLGGGGAVDSPATLSSGDTTPNLGRAGTEPGALPAESTSDPMGSLSEGRASAAQLAEAQRARELGVSTETLRAQESATDQRQEIAQRTALYLDRGYDEATAKAQATRDIEGERVGGGWSNKAMALGAGSTKAILGGLLGGTGIAGAARESLPGWAQRGVGAVESRANTGVALLRSSTSSAIAKHQLRLESASEERRGWIAKEASVAAATTRLREAQSSGDPLAVAAALEEVKRSERLARAAHRKVAATGQTFAGRMATTRLPLLGAGLRRRDGITTDSTAVRANLERLDRELSRLRADRLIREGSSGARSGAALEKLDQKIAVIESQRAKISARSSSYEQMHQIAGRRRQDEARSAEMRAKAAATRARNIDEIYRREAQTPDRSPERIARLGAIEERRNEARRAAELAAERARRLGPG